MEIPVGGPLLGSGCKPCARYEPNHEPDEVHRGELCSIGAQRQCPSVTELLNQVWSRGSSDIAGGGFATVAEIDHTPNLTDHGFDSVRTFAFDRWDTWVPHVGEPNRCRK